MKYKMLELLAIFLVTTWLCGGTYLIINGHLTCYIELADSTCMIVAVITVLSTAGSIFTLLSYDTLKLAELGCKLYPADKLELACSAICSLPFAFMWDNVLLRELTGIFGVTDE